MEMWIVSGVFFTDFRFSEMEGFADDKLNVAKML